MSEDTQNQENAPIEPWYDIVPPDERLSFLPTLLGDLAKNPHALIEIEAYPQHFLREMAPSDYQGGFWQFARLRADPAMGFMIPDLGGKDDYLLESPNGSSAHLSAEAAGITVWLMGMSNMSFRYHDKPNGDRVAELYHGLREAIPENYPELDKIMMLLD